MRAVKKGKLRFITGTRDISSRGGLHLNRRHGRIGSEKHHPNSLDKIIIAQYSDYFKSKIDEFTVNKRGYRPF
ncbi:MAG: hypothetical protein LUC51_03315, partial [Cloacibacillus porcorum]|nr:hypothetical protein [Cloacibacillus porcorum]